MEFNTLDEIKNEFIDGTFDFPAEFTVSGIKYKMRSSTNYSLEAMIRESYKGAIVYSTPSINNQDEDLSQIGLRESILFLWDFTSKNLLAPSDVRTINLAPNSTSLEEGAEDNFIGSTVEVRITNIPGSSSMKGKVDTGADICSLHAEAWKVENSYVRFKCPELSQNTITASLVNHQAVKSADGGTEYRPLIELNIKINGKLLNNVMFNLNDRGQMQYPVLIGRNALQAGKFKIDPSLDESADIDWGVIQEQFKDSTSTDYFSISEIVQILQDHNK